MARIAPNLTFHVSADYPEQTLEHCAAQVEMLVDLISSTQDMLLSEQAVVGMCDLLRSVGYAMGEVQQLVHARRPRAAA